MELEFSFRRYFDEKNSKYERNVSPGVEFRDVPEEAESIALIMDDPDAPGEGAFTHWVIWNIPADHDLPEDLPRESRLDFGAISETPEGVSGDTQTSETFGVQGSNDFNETGYGGPKPPRGERHEYRIRAYAVDKELELGPGAKKKHLTQKIDGHVVDKAEEKIPYKRDLDETTKELGESKWS